MSRPAGPYICSTVLTRSSVVPAGCLPRARSTLSRASFSENPSATSAVIASLALCGSALGAGGDRVAAPADAVYRSTGKRGVHSEHMGFILAEMQQLQRAYPGGVW